MYSNIINRDIELSKFDKHQFFYIRVKKYDALGDDIDKLFSNEQLYNQTIFIKIERIKKVYT
jgi:hypothetical protein